MAVGGGNTLLTLAMVAEGADPADASVVTRELRQARFLSADNRGKVGSASVEAVHAAAWVVAYGAPIPVARKAKYLATLWRLPLVETIEVTHHAHRQPGGAFRTREEHVRELKDSTVSETASAGEYIRAVIDRACVQGRDWLLDAVSHAEVWSNCARLDLVWAGGGRWIFATPSERSLTMTAVGFQTIGRVGASVLAAASDVVLASREAAEKLGIEISTEETYRALGYAPTTKTPASPVSSGEVDESNEKAPPPCHRDAAPNRNKGQSDASRRLSGHSNTQKGSEGGREFKAPSSARGTGRSFPTHSAGETTDVTDTQHDRIHD